MYSDPQPKPLLHPRPQTHRADTELCLMYSLSYREQANYYSYIILHERNSFNNTVQAIVFQSVFFTTLPWRQSVKICSSFLFDVAPIRLADMQLM